MLISNIYPLATLLLLSSSALVLLFSSVTIITTTTTTAFVIVVPTSSSRQYCATTKTFTTTFLVNESSEPEPVAAVVVATSESEEKPKPKKKKKQPQQQPAAEPIEIDISKLDIRVGVIEKAWEHVEADTLYCEEINIGEKSGPRNIASGLKAHYQLEEMIGTKVLVVANLKARKLVGFASHGMVLCACQYGDAEDGTSEDVVEFVIPHEDSKIGDRVFCEGYENNGAPPATENAVIKKKMLKVIFPDLKINKDGIAVYKDQPLFTTTLSTTSEDDNNNDDGEEEEKEVKKLPCRAMTLTDVPIS